MESLFAALNHVFRFITPVSDWIWDFPTNYSWWSAIPVLGNFSLAVILLLGTGIYFTLRLCFIQVTQFKTGVRLIARKRVGRTGISPGAAFFLSTAMRVGPGNIIGVTGAITTGGPGALFWMWVSAFFGMATAYVESTMAQIFKRRDGENFVGGLPFYGRKLVKNSAVVGIFLSVLYILYALCCFPAQGFNTITAVGSIAGLLTGRAFAPDSALYWIAGAAILLLTAYIVFGGIRKVTKVTDQLVPVMAVIYCLTVLVLIVLNFNRIPAFFGAVFGGAFRPEAVFGGAFGVALQQGIKRGLMSNEAGQGTITMPAGASGAEHPCEQGFVQAVGVFLDTMVICTLTGFVVIMGHLWTTEQGMAFLKLDQLEMFLASAAELTPGTAMNTAVTLLICLCFGLFAYTCLIGFVSFSEISAARISSRKCNIVLVRLLCLFVAAFGMVCNMAGYNLSNLWAFSDLGNILIVYFNLPLLYLGFRYVRRATAHYRKRDGTAFSESVAGTELDEWREPAEVP